VFNSHNESYLPTTKTCDIVDEEGQLIQTVPIQYSNLKPRYDGHVYGQVNYLKTVVTSTDMPIYYFDIRCDNVKDRGVIYKEKCTYTS